MAHRYKKDPEGEAQALGWISEMLGETLPAGEFDEILEDGLILCRLAEKIAGKKIPHNKKPKTKFQKMENAQSFQQVAKDVGVRTMDTFQPVDLVERKDIPQVLQCVFAVARVLQAKPGWSGPELGPKQATENKREFTDEQLNAGKDVISLQYGSNKGATAAGVNMGQTRHM